MSKVSGAYESVVRGVSEQVPQDRRSGQHFDQINMISDPVRGLARRHGSKLQDEKVIASYDPVVHAKWLADTARHKVFTFFIDGVEYDIMYRSTADTQSLGSTTFAWAFNKVTQKIIPVTLGADTATLVAGGVSSIVNVGKYLFLAGNNIVPAYTANDAWGNATNKQHMAVWIRGGDYSRTYTVTLTKLDNSKLTFSYKTFSASYQGTLDTSDIASSDGQYQKKVNDRVNAYNSAVTAWIGQAANDIAPENIAAKLRLAAIAAGVSASEVTVFNGTLCIDSTSYKEVSGDDSGDGSLILPCGNEIADLDHVSLNHFAGKIVKVRPRKNSGKDALYLKAIPKNPTDTGWSEVTWREVAGYAMTPQAPFCIGTIKAGTLYIAATPASLTTLCGDATPDFKPNEVGDDITSPLPYFIGKKISYLGLFQDRLVIGSGAVLFFSRPGDYFNWFRQSVLSINDDDPVEMYALGSEDDVIRASTTYDKNLVLFGERNQYAINGRAPVSLKNPIFVMSSHEDAVDANPQNSGNFVFYAKTRNGITSMHQVQMGQLAESPESFTISQQLDRYIKGKAVEIVAVTSPNCVFLRTDANRNVLYTYAYLDTATGSERLFDSWSKWTWHSRLGDMIGLSHYQGDILVYMLRHGVDRDGNQKVWLGVERFVLDTSTSPYPYVDSVRTTASCIAPSADSFLTPVATDMMAIGYMAYGSDHQYRFIGTDLPHLTTFIEQYPDAVTSSYVGIGFPAYTIPTNPYIRDPRTNRAIIVGRFTLGKLTIAIADSGGIVVELTTSGGTRTVADFSGRILGRSTNLVGRQPIVTTTVPAAIGREVRECSYKMAAKTFLPLTITAIEWTGQYFNNVRRV